MKVTTLTLIALAAAAPLVHAAEPRYEVRMQPLPVGDAATVSMDYIAYDPSTHSVWAPAGNTGIVAVVDTATGAVRGISGFTTAEVGSGDRKRTVGPSAASVGDGIVYVGNRGDSSVCSFDAKTLAKVACRNLDAMPDGVAAVTSKNEVWVTTPRDKSIRVLDGKTLEERGTISFEGGPEGFAVDAKRGRFYTNLEDKDLTLAIDLATRKTVATWKSHCGAEGPRGLKVDPDSGRVLLACTNRMQVLDAPKDGKVLGSVETGEGVDDLDYAPSTRLLYAGAGKAGTLTIAKLEKDGKLTLVAKVPTHAGARNPVVTEKGEVYLAHGSAGGLKDLVVVSPAK